MSNYSKSKLKKKRLIPIIIVIFISLLIIASVFVIYLSIKNNIVIEKVDDSAKLISDDVAKKSTPIIVNNIVIGAVNDKTWVSSDKYYFNSSNKENTDIDVYNKTGKAGKYNISKLEKDSDNISPYVVTSRVNKSDEYFAIGANATDNMLVPGVSESITDEDYSLTKKALGMYRMLNSSIKISSVYDIEVNSELSGKIICVTSKGKNIFGVYSAVVFVDEYNKVTLIKYNYIKNVKKATNWPVYSFEFCADLNSDGQNELILQETYESSIKYDILEYRDNKFYEVLSSSLKI